MNQLLYLTQKTTIMRLFLVSLLFLISYPIIAQEYKPLIKGQKCWEIWSRNDLYLPPENQYSDRLFLDEADTITYNGLIYHNVRRGYSGSEINAIIREDTVEQKVWCIFQSEYNNYFQCEEGEEILLYDFDVELGDTIQHYSNSESSESSVVQDIYFNAQGEEVIYLETLGGIVVFGEYVQGRGSLYHGIFGYFNNLSSGWNDYLKFYRENCTPLNVSTQNVILPKWTISPNPVNFELYINSAENIDPVLLELRNSVGQIVRKIPFSKSINMSELPVGFYFLSLFGKERLLLGTHRILRIDN